MSLKHKFGIQVDKSVIEQLLERKVFIRERIWTTKLISYKNSYYRGAVGALLVYGKIAMIKYVNTKVLKYILH